MQIKKSKSQAIVGGVQHGHMWINPKNHASKGAVVAMPVGTNFAAIGARRRSAQRAPIKAGTPKE